jgi:hypothetical protein
MRMLAYRFGVFPEQEFAPGGMLEGFEDSGDYDADVAELEAAGYSLQEFSGVEVTGRLPDGRLAVVGDTITGNVFWIASNP